MLKDVTTHELQIVTWQRGSHVTTTGKQYNPSQNPPGRDATNNKKIKKLFLDAAGESKEGNLG